MLRKRSLLVNAIIEAANHLKRMKVTPKEIMDGLIFPTEAYSRPGSKKLIDAIKNEDLETVKKMITKDKYLLYIHVGDRYDRIVQRQADSTSLGGQKKPTPDC
jgi:hypothetical protein